MNAKTRAARFIERLTGQKAVTMQVHTQGQRRFAKASKIMLPVLLAIAAAYASTPEPRAQIQVDDGVVVTQPTVEQRVVSGLKRASLNLESFERCMRQRYITDHPGINLEDAETNLRFAVGLAVAKNALQANNEIAEHLETFPEDEMLAVAAYCENPANWYLQLEIWKDRRNQVMDHYESNGGDMEKAIDQVITSYAVEIFDDTMGEINLVEQTALFLDAKDRLFLKDDGYRRLRTEEVSGHDWARAATSILDGIGAFSEDRDGGAAGSAAKIIRQGSDYGRSAERVGSARSTSDKLSRFGGLIGKIGRESTRNRESNKPAQAPRIREGR